MIDPKNKKILAVIGGGVGFLAVVALVMAGAGKGALFKGLLNPADFEMAAPVLLPGGVLAPVVGAHDLTDVSVVPDSLVANTTNHVAVQFTTGSVWPSDGYFVINFPPGFVVDPTIGVSSTCNLAPGQYDITQAGSSTIQVVRKAILPAPLPVPGGTKISCDFSTVKNPGAGTTKNFAIFTGDKKGQIDNGSAGGISIVDAQVLKDISIVLTPAVAGAVSTVNFKFTTSSDLPDTGAILFQLPGGFDASGGKVKSCNLPGTFDSKFFATSFRLTRTGGGTMPGGTKVDCSFDGFMNTPVVGLTGVFGIRTVYSNFNLIDETADIPGVKIDPTPPAPGAPAAVPLAPPVAGKLTNAKVGLASLKASDSTVAGFQFTYGSPMSNGKIVFYFPKSFNLSKATYKSCINLAGDLSGSSSTADSTLTINILGGKTTAAGTAIVCAFDNVINPSAAGPTGDFKVSTFDNFGGVLDQSGPFPGPAIAAAGAVPGAGAPVGGIPLGGGIGAAVGGAGGAVPGAGLGPNPGLPPRDAGAVGGKKAPDFDTEVITPPKAGDTPPKTDAAPPKTDTPPKTTTTTPGAVTSTNTLAVVPPKVLPPPLPSPDGSPLIQDVANFGLDMPADVSSSTPAAPSAPVSSSSSGSAAQPAARPPIQASNCAGINYPRDIDGHWANPEIKKAFDLCLFAKIPSGRFYPDKAITRFQALKLVMLAAGIVPDYNCSKKSCTPPFTDLKDSELPWVTAAWENKIITGYGKRFYGADTLSREEGAALLLKAFRIPPFRGCYTNNCGAGYPNNFFTDITDAWVGPYIRVLWDRKLIAPAGENRFYPKANITRGEWVYYVMSLR